jgi:hypothetical protein
MTRAAALSVLVAACSGGGGSTGGGDGGVVDSVVNIDANEFARDCTTTDDCMAVRTGNVCSVCSCQSATIAKKANDAYTKRFQELRATCGPQSTKACSNDCADPRFACVSGTCTWGVRPPDDAGAD